MPVANCGGVLVVCAAAGAAASASAPGTATTTVSQRARRVRGRTTGCTDGWALMVVLLDLPARSTGTGAGAAAAAPAEATETAEAADAATEVGGPGTAVRRGAARSGGAGQRRGDVGEHHLVA